MSHEHEYIALLNDEEDDKPERVRTFGDLILDKHLPSAIGLTIVHFTVLIAYYTLRHTSYRLDEPWTREAVELAKWCTTIGMFHWMILIMAGFSLSRQPVFTKGLRGSTILALYMPLIWCFLGVVALFIVCILYIQNRADINGPPRPEDDPTNLYVAQVHETGEKVVYIVMYVSLGASIVNYMIFGRAGKINLMSSSNPSDRC